MQFKIRKQNILLLVILTKILGSNSLIVDKQKHNFTADEIAENTGSWNNMNTLNAYIYVTKMI